MNTNIHDNLNDFCDEQLCIKIVKRQKDWQTAFSVLIERYHVYLYKRCLYRLNNQSDIDDVLQNIYLSIYRFLGQFEGRSSLKTWLTRIADNHCANTMRKQQKALKQQSMLIEHMQVLMVLNETNDDACLNNQSEQCHIIASLMTHLTHKSQEILTLRYWSELSLEEIATTLGIGVSAVKMRLQRALQQCSMRISLEQCMMA